MRYHVGMNNDLLPTPDHALRFSGSFDNIHEAPTLGNGDLAAMVQVLQHEFRLHLGKQDIYDARCAVPAADVAIPQADLIRYGEEYGFRWPMNSREPEWDRLPPDAPTKWSSADGLSGPAPCPKPAGCIVIAHSGISDTRIDTVLDIARGVVHTAYYYDYGWHGTATLHIEAFVNREANTVHLRLRTEGLVGALHLMVEKLPERLDPTIPLPEVRAIDQRTAVVSQTIPGGCGVEPFTWRLAARFPESTQPAEALVWQDGKGYMASSGEEIVETTDPVCAAWTVFPAEYVDGDEEEGLAPVIRDIMERYTWSTMHPRMIWIHHWWCAIPALRLGLPGAFQNARSIILKEQFPAGHARTTHWINLQPDAWRCPEDNYLGVAAVTEMLLQSQGEVIRLFPAWLRELAARFRNLPARGSFLVSAAWQPGEGLQATIASLAGEDCRIRWKEDAPPEIACTDNPVPFRREGKDLVFPTEKGKAYEIRKFLI